MTREKFKKGQKILPKANEAGRMLSQIFFVLKLGAAHGIQGALKYQVLGQFEADTECVYDMLLLDKEERFVAEVEVEFGGKGKTAYCYIEGIENRTEAEQKTHFYLALRREDMPPLEDGEYYVQDLIGLQVFSETYGNIGTVKEVLQQSAQDVYVVDRTHLGKKDLLFVDDGKTLKHVDIIQGKMQVELADGLWEIYEI